MKTLQTSETEKGVSFTAADFYEAGRERLQLQVAAGEAFLDRVIEEPVVNRPGLALTGFFEDFAWARVQLIGNAESAYLKSLDRRVREERFRALVERKAWLFVTTNGHKPDAVTRKMADEMGAVILTSPLQTRVFARLATFILEQLGAPRTSI